MKTKRKEKEKTEEKKRSEVLPRFELGPFGASGECFTTRPRGTLKKSWRNFIIKTWSLIKHEFKDIFQKNDCSLDNENPT